MVKHINLVLIVDDQPRGQQILASLLETEGYQLAYANNGPEALALARTLIPDLVLLDVMMPGMDGFEVCRRLRADPLLSLIPVVLVTALDDNSARMQGIEAGADDFVTKPFNRAELRARVRTITRLNRFRTLLDERQQSAEELAHAYDATLTGWSRALELRDHETEGHSRRVTSMTLRLAIEMGIIGPELEQIRRGALLHDIGKMGIPDSILLKPGPLSDEEWTIMRRHPVIAYDLLSPVSFLHDALAIPWCHHEKWDGTGYPRGLRGEEIPLAARIFAIVDVWDALSNDRPYRLAWPPERVESHLRSLANTHFDPRIVGAFMNLIASSYMLEVVH
ncbi:MAG: response regulator [Oscillochloris sp.]|nr:response regulator [Oscillochloris sp.]